MAKSPVQNPTFRTTGDVNVDTGREPVQLGWYELASRFCKGRDVLDVGCGMGDGLAFLARTATRVRGIDADERLKRANVEITDIRNLDSKSVDVITCIDVIEHVEEDLDFLHELARVARCEVILSTPNWTFTRCSWSYHVREYMPHELMKICKPLGRVEMYKGAADGWTRYPVHHPTAYGILNRLLVFPPTYFAARVWNHFLPKRCRVAPALFVRLHLESRTEPGPS